MNYNKRIYVKKKLQIYKLTNNLYLLDILQSNFRTSRYMWNLKAENNGSHCALYRIVVWLNFLKTKRFPFSLSQQLNDKAVRIPDSILLAIVSAPFAALVWKKVSIDREKFRLVYRLYSTTMPHGNRAVRRCASIYDTKINRSQGKAHWYNLHFAILNYIPIHLDQIQIQNIYSMNLLLYCLINFSAFASTILHQYLHCANIYY